MLGQETISQRIDMFITHFEMNPNSFAKATGTHVQSVHKIIKGIGFPAYEFIFKVLNKFPSVSAEWLILGNGEMIKNSTNEHFSEAKNISVSENSTIIVSLNKEVKHQQEIIQAQRERIKDLEYLVKLFRPNENQEIIIKEKTKPPPS